MTDQELRDHLTSAAYLCLDAWISIGADGKNVTENVKTLQVIVAKIAQEVLS